VRAVLDACVLYPTLLREILLGAASAGLIVPLWSDRILEEWRLAVRRHHPEQDGAAEIGLVVQRFPDATVAVREEVVAGLSLPDADDRHVLASALEGGAQLVITLNLRDFPGRTLVRHGVGARSPDSLLWELHATRPAEVGAVVTRALADLRDATGETRADRALLKRAGLPRLGKALAGP
jgi:predicted nucleic acid-binding protein